MSVFILSKNINDVSLRVNTIGNCKIILSSQLKNLHLYFLLLWLNNKTKKRLKINKIKRKYSLSFKKEVITFAKENNIYQTVKKYGLSKNTVKKWVKLENDIKVRSEPCLYNESGKNITIDGIKYYLKKMGSKNQSISIKKIKEDFNIVQSISTIYRYFAIKGFNYQNFKDKYCNHYENSVDNWYTLHLFYSFFKDKDKDKELYFGCFIFVHPTTKLVFMRLIKTKEEKITVYCKFCNEMISFLNIFDNKSEKVIKNDLKIISPNSLLIAKLKDTNINYEYNREVKLPKEHFNLVGKLNKYRKRTLSVEIKYNRLFFETYLKCKNNQLISSSKKELQSLSTQTNCKLKKYTKLYFSNSKLQNLAFTGLFSIAEEHYEEARFLLAKEYFEEGEKLALLLEDKYELNYYKIYKARVLFKLGNYRGTRRELNKVGAESKRIKNKKLYYLSEIFQADLDLIHLKNDLAGIRLKSVDKYFASTAFYREQILTKYICSRYNFRQQNYFKAIDTINQALKIYKEHNVDNIYLFLNIYNYKGVIYKSMEEYNNAIKIFNNIIKYALENNSEKNLIKGYSNLTTVYARNGEYKKAIEKGHYVLKKFKLPLLQRAKRLLNICNCYYYLNDFKKAEKIINNIVKTSTVKKRKILKYSFLSFLQAIYFETDRKSKSKNICLKMLLIAENGKDYKRIYRMKNLLKRF